MGADGINPGAYLALTQHLAVHLDAHIDQLAVKSLYSCSDLPCQRQPACGGLPRDAVNDQG